ncbi:MAG: AAA family ATPase [Chloroflexi bacterium]|nr:AAA family ATPase [Chloroflexota bacterium]
MSTIIFLNGTSSSGKTSLLKALQNQLREPYLDMGIDRFIWMLPKRYLDRPLWDDVLGKAHHSGPVGLILFSGMHHAIAAAASRGNNVVADHVFVEKAWADECANLFADMNAYLIGIHCPLEVLEQRERGRKDRTLGQARAQFDVIHRYTKYDLEVDTSLLTPEQCAQKIIERLQSPPVAFKKLR